jgi:phosphoglycolate phosphatase-like HAD superfamily hydrolase
MSTTPTPAPLVVGFDLDMTLIDTVPGFKPVLAALAEELGVELPIDKLTERLGPPLDHNLRPYLPAEQIPYAVDRFRQLYPVAVPAIPALAGAHEALAAVTDRGGRVLVVTGKFTRNAQLHLDHLKLVAHHLEGEVWGVGKADVLRREGASIYVGDHIHDVEGARAAGVVSVSVLTGGCSREELLDAGTHVVLETLHDFPDWLDDHLRDTAVTDTTA